MCIYIYIYIGREREREREQPGPIFSTQIGNLTPCFGFGRRIHYLTLTIEHENRPTLCLVLSKFEGKRDKKKIEKKKKK